MNKTYQSPGLCSPWMKSFQLMTSGIHSFAKEKIKIISRKPSPEEFLGVVSKQLSTVDSNGYMYSCLLHILLSTVVSSVYISLSTQDNYLNRVLPIYLSTTDSSLQISLSTVMYIDCYQLLRHC